MSLATGNNFLQDLCRLMNQTAFQEFKTKYIRDWSDMETVLLFMNMYEYFSNEYFHRFQHKMSDEQMVSLLRFVFNDRTMRRKAIQVFRKYQASPNTKFQDHVNKQKFPLTLK